LQVHRWCRPECSHRYR